MKGLDRDDRCENGLRPENGYCEPEKPRLLDQVRNAIRLKHYSIRTEQSYIDWIRRYIFFHNKKHPADLDEGHISSFLTYLAVDKKVASSTQNQALCALVFLYRHVLQNHGPIHVCRIRWNFPPHPGPLPKGEGEDWCGLFSRSLKVV